MKRLKNFFQSSFSLVLCCILGEIFIWIGAFFLDSTGVLIYGIFPMILLFCGFSIYFQLIEQQIDWKITIVISAFLAGTYYCITYFSGWDCFDLINRVLLYWFLSLALYRNLKNKKTALIITISIKTVTMFLFAIFFSWFFITRYYIIRCSIVATILVEYILDEFDTISLVLSVIFASLSPLLIVVFHYGNERLKKPCKVFWQKLLAPHNPPSEF